MQTLTIRYVIHCFPVISNCMTVVMQEQVKHRVVNRTTPCGGEI